MKKIVPFNKNIEMGVSEIVSISLEHNLSLKEDNLISGLFTISGTCKKEVASLNEENFEYKLPFDISIDKKYDCTNVDVDINNFYYELKDRNLSINIEVAIDNLEEIRESLEEEVQTVDELPIEPAVKSMFEDLDDNERYSVYKVHVVMDSDTVESILEKYEITKEALEEYNDLSELKIGDKVIIPANA